MYSVLQKDRDEYFMSQAITEAQLGFPRAMPNPMVGAVLVHKDVIIGKGYHQFFGGPHAEVNCIKNFVETQKDITNDTETNRILSESTIYVTLEPCSHTGKTPPCAHLILKHGIPRVVVGSDDPNPDVSGKGFDLLRKHGVSVTTHCLKLNSDKLNQRFFHFYTNHRPSVFIPRLLHLSPKVFENEMGVLIDDLGFWDTVGDNQIVIILDQHLKFDYSSIDTTRLKTIVCTEIQRNSTFEGKDFRDLTNSIQYLHCDYENSFPTNLMSLLFQLNIQTIVANCRPEFCDLLASKGLSDLFAIY